jgi:mono/diheme cytochrome c family protein
MKSVKRIVLAVSLMTALGFVLDAQTPAGGQDANAGQAGPQGRGGRGGPGGQAGARGGARGSVGTTPPPTSPVTGSSVEGKKLFFNYSCYSCHGYNGEGQQPFVGRWGNLQTEAGFIAFLRLRGDRASSSPATSMPNFPEKTLSDKQAKDIYAYIRTFTSHSPEVKDVPTLNAIVNAASKPYKP